MKQFYQESSLKELCGLFGKSRQAYYQQEKRLIKEELAYEIVLKLVKEIRKKLPRCGTRKLYHMLESDLLCQEIKLGRDGLFLLLKANNMLVFPKKRYTKTTNSHHWLKKYADLTLGLELKHTEQLWVSDITYIRLKEGFCYLALITDAYSRKIVGWHLGKSLEAELCVKALEMALEGRKRNCPLIHHSDRGVQYCSEKYVQLLQKNEVKISMTQDGSPYENALAERMNCTLKIEFNCDIVFEDFHAAEKQIQSSIQNYNTFRPHSSLDYLTPEQAEGLEGEIKKRWKKKMPEQTECPPAGGHSVNL